MSRVAREAWDRNGAGLHADRRTKRQRTRETQENLALEEYDELAHFWEHDELIYEEQFEEGTDFDYES